ncbi:hypothetical protein [Marinigracilibium pacificum]|uniref:Uncharacterized protein n=1 Tax=Marinigracilibium pacificum TaxID=2729599 RepID=A0A848J3Z6_9BACT|nr:hypothetical protein [Marinigracilibium pacificum]NMM49250.1 hypothetical protein [Marinigracilibium pacificum]
MANQENDHLPLLFDDIIFLKEDEIDFHLNSSDKVVSTSSEVTLQQESLSEPEPVVETSGSIEIVDEQSDETANENDIPEADSPNLFEGDNKKAITVYAAQINDTDKAFLMKVISAVNIGLTDIALTTDIDSLFMIEPQEVIISFGSEELLQGPFAGSAMYSVEEVGDVKSLLCDELSKIAEDKDLKMKLWQGLKSLFN